MYDQIMSILNIVKLVVCHVALIVHLIVAILFMREIIDEIKEHKKI